VSFQNKVLLTEPQGQTSYSSKLHAVTKLQNFYR